MYMRRLIHEDGDFKAVVLDSTEIGRAYFTGSGPSPIALQLMTQAMTGALLLSSELKDEGTMLLKFSGDGPMGQITVEANTDGHVKGYSDNASVNFDRAYGVGLFQQAVGQGRLSVIRRTQKMKRAYESVTELVDGEMALNLAHYLLSSNQVKAGIQLGAKLDRDHGVAGAGGILIQALPGANDNLLFILEDRLSTMPGLGTMFAQPDGLDQVVDYLFGGTKVKSLGDQGVVYRCNCSRARMIQVISALPLTELEELERENKDFEIDCQFCNQSWPCSADDLRAVIEHKKAGTA